MRHVAELVEVLHDQRPVEPVLGAQRVELLGRDVGGVGAGDQGDRVARQRVEDQERHGERRPQHEHRLQQAAQDVAGDHAGDVAAAAAVLGEVVTVPPLSSRLVGLTVFAT